MSISEHLPNFKVTSGVPRWPTGYRSAAVTVRDQVPWPRNYHLLCAQLKKKKKVNFKNVYDRELPLWVSGLRT